MVLCVNSERHTPILKVRFTLQRKHTLQNETYLFFIRFSFSLRQQKSFVQFGQTRYKYLKIEYSTSLFLPGNHSNTLRAFRFKRNCLLHRCLALVLRPAF